MRRPTRRCSGSFATRSGSRARSSAAASACAAPARCTSKARPTRSCITPISAVEGAEVTTIEGLDPAGDHPVQKAWRELQVPQCGYCQSGQIMQAAALLKDFPNPTDADIDAVMNGNLCRCMAYVRIRDGDQDGGRPQRSRRRPMTRPLAARCAACALAPAFFVTERRPRARCSAWVARRAQGAFLTGRPRPARASTDRSSRPSGSASIATASPDQHRRRDGPARRHGARPHPRRRAGGRLELGASRQRRYRSQVGPDGHRRQLLGVAELSHLEPGRRRGAHRADRARARSCWASRPAPASPARARVEAGGRSIGYGDIVARGDLARRFSADELTALPIKTPDKRTLIGQARRRPRHPGKTTGEAVYGIDAEVDGMVYARPKLPPTRYGSTVLSIDDTAAKAGAGLPAQHRARRPVRHRARLGDGHRRDLSGGHPRHRAGEGAPGSPATPPTVSEPDLQRPRRAR